MPFLASEEACMLSTEQVVERVQTDLHNGLSPTEAERRRTLNGFNEFQISEEEPLWKKYLGQVTI